jgi:hypothetical protein
METLGQCKKYGSSKMFYFVNFSGDPKSQSYDQGVLFEELVKKIVDTLGYKVTDWREKISGKEYDIRAEAKLGKRTLIGEAKARRENQTMPVITIRELWARVEAYVPSPNFR